MRRSIFDTLRRGVDNTLANWQVSLIRLIEAILFGALVFGAVILMLIPIFVSVGISLSDLNTPEAFESAFEALFRRGMILVWIFAVVAILLFVFIVLHSFIEAGCARVMVDGDRVAGPALAGPRSRYAVFSMERWLTGAKDGFWEVFWIYNAIWGVGGLLLLIPLIPAVAIIFILRENTGAAIALGCVTLAFVVLLCILIAVVLGMWTNRAIVEWANRRGSIRTSLSLGFRYALRTDLGRHLLITLAVIVVSMAAGAALASFGFVASIGESVGNHRGMFNVITLPLRLFTTVLNWAFTSLLTSWYLASYAALSVEGRS